MVDIKEENGELYDNESLIPLNASVEKKKRSTAVALKGPDKIKRVPEITAAGHGAIAEKILQLAFENGIKVREDSDLAEMLAAFEIDSPIPQEAFMAVAEILRYVYMANGMHNPFDVAINNEQDVAQN